MSEAKSETKKLEPKVSADELNDAAAAIDADVKKLREECANYEDGAPLLAHAVSGLHGAAESIRGFAKKIAKPAAVALFLLVLMLAPKLKAGFQVNGGPILLTVTTNSGLNANSPYLVYLPQTTYIISGITNPYTTITNNFCQTLTTNGVTFSVSTNFVFIAASNGLAAASPANPMSWTNVFPQIAVAVPNNSFFQAQPQNGGSNTCYVQSY